MNAVLIVRHVDGREEAVELAIGVHRVGREDADIIVADPNVSALHAQLTVSETAVSLNDAGSSNGTFDAAGQRLTAAHVLQLGQPIRMGATTLTLTRLPASYGRTVALDQTLATTMRGTIIKVPDTTPGLLMVDGKQHSFMLEGVWNSAVAPAPNMAVSVVFAASGQIASVVAVDPQVLAKERLNLLGNAAQEHGLQAAAIAKQSLGSLSARLGKVELAAAAAIWIAWFFLPIASINFIATKSFTFWDVLSVDVTNPLNNAGSHGLFSWFGIAAIAAPFARPYVKHSRARLLNAAPAGFLLLYALIVWLELRDARKSVEAVAGNFGGLVAATQQSVIDSMLQAVSFGLGMVVLPVAALVLAARSLKTDDEAGTQPSASAGALSFARVLASRQGKLIAAAAILAAAGYAGWQAFGGELSKGALREKIDQKLAAEGKVCWALQNMNVQFPVHVRQGFGAGTNQDPILQGLARGGYIAVSQGPGGFMGMGGATIVDLTAKGRGAQVWHPKEGFCLGRKQVHEVLQWSEPAQQAGAMATQISYTWILGDRPDWAEEKLFQSVPGVGKPVPGTALATKMNDGWTIVAAM